MGDNDKPAPRRAKAAARPATRLLRERACVARRPVPPRRPGASPRSIRVINRPRAVVPVDIIFCSSESNKTKSHSHSQRPRGRRRLSRLGLAGAEHRRSSSCPLAAAVSPPSTAACRTSTSYLLMNVWPDSLLPAAALLLALG